MKRILKNPKTYLILIILAPLILLGGFLFNYYQIYKVAVDPLANNTDISNSNVIVKNPFETIEAIETIEDSTKNIDFPKEKNSSETKEGSSTTDNPVVVESAPKENSSTENPSSKTPTGSKETTTSNKPDPSSYNYIVSTYKSKFEKLQKKQENSLYALIERGKVDYVERKEKKTSIMSLANKYLTLVNEMEKQSDQEFNGLVQQFKEELTSHSHNTEIVKEITDYYQYYKKTLRAQLFKKASDHL